MYLEDFQALFELPEFVRLWHPSDLGEIFCYAISKWRPWIYPSFIEPLINRHFSGRKEALLWLFLGAHAWLVYRNYLRAPDSILKGFRPVLFEKSVCS
jgi:hypothetical protein